MPGSSRVSSARGTTARCLPFIVNTSMSTPTAEGATGSSPPWKSGCETRPTCQSWA